jgi:hypothetical protein
MIQLRIVSTTREKRYNSDTIHKSFIEQCEVLRDLYYCSNM